MASFHLTRWRAALILALLFTAPAAADDLSSFTLDLAVLTVPAPPGAEMKVIGQEPGQPVSRWGGRQATVWPGVSEVRFGELRLTFDQGVMLWNDTPGPPDGSGIQHLIERRVSIQTGQPTQIRAIVDDLHYFEAAKGGLFELKSVSKRDLPGLLLDCEAEDYRDGPDGGLIEFDYKLRLVVVEGREELAGAPEMPGKPRLARFKLNRSEELPAGAWHLVSGHLVSETGGRQGNYLLVLIRITPVE
jgi:hypothetical protein